MKKKHVLPIISFMFCLQGFSQTHSLTKLWQTDTLLKTPESVLYKEGLKFLLVSNIDGQADAKDGKGSIGKISLDGKIIKTDWVTGLNAPKGLGLYKNKLYVADITDVVVIDIDKEKIIETIPVDGSVFLNDITIDKKGIVYVSDTKLSKVYKIENGKVALFVDNIKNANGLLAVNDDVYALANGNLLKIDAAKNVTTLATGMETSTDGIEMVNNTDFIVSSWIGVVYYVKTDGTKEVLLNNKDLKINTADIGYDAKKKIVYIPTFYKNFVAAYQLK
ncbi:MAG: ATP/GTP-binding protein [Chitinophaga sp.]|jgi:sugar lactone lactonase YvrE|nr:ATP/GTP-binding protein [Chitinophaga sp.]